MAYVVTRPAGRFEIRESVHTPKGPRAHSLANFSLLTDKVLAVAAERSTRPFDVQAVLASAGKVGAPTVASRIDGHNRTVGGSEEASTSLRRFVESSQRMAKVLERPPAAQRSDPGSVLIDLLDFADAVVRSQPPRPFEPLAFPVLARLSEPPPGGTSPHRR
jgi:hypothetical protein